MLLRPRCISQSELLDFVEKDVRAVIEPMGVAECLSDVREASEDALF